MTVREIKKRNKQRYILRGLALQFSIFCEKLILHAVNRKREQHDFALTPKASEVLDFLFQYTIKSLYVF